MHQSSEDMADACKLWTYHIEGNDILERNLTRLVLFYEDLVYEKRTASRWKAEDERSSLCWGESVYSVLEFRACHRN